MRFKSAGFGTRIVYYFMPNLTLQEAAAMASKVNGPFTSDAVSDLDFVDASLAGAVLLQKVAWKALMHGLPQVTKLVSLTLTSTSHTSKPQQAISAI